MWLSNGASDMTVSLPAIKLLGDLLEEKETELSNNMSDQELEALNELWDLYQRLLD